ncbi:MAG TPA: aminomethyl-transferring glycine dehydrogenase subunit GcvPA [Candidatus Obscuribacterales bacterium]
MHTPYLAHTPAERQAMLATLGARDIEALFSVIPASLHDVHLELPGAVSELELQREFENLAGRNCPAGSQISFIGAGSYRHYIPAALPVLAGRSEFLTAYTPYQAEVSQGTLQVIYEFQSALCTLTGMDIANASTYEGATASAEAMTMATRITRRKDLLVSPGLHPEYREVLGNYARSLELKLHTGKLSGGALDLSSFDAVAEPAALMVQYPDFFGQVPDLQVLADWIHARGGLLIVIVNDPVVLGLLEAPGHLGADIVAGEAQAFGNGLNFGGPNLGYLTAREAHIRQMPGRMSGLSVDADGQRAYTLVLQTREQHIRREKATSNICTNQGLNALMATIWLALIGKQGLTELSSICFQRAHYAAAQISALPHFRLAFDGPFFHEFVLACDTELTPLLNRLQAQGCLPGLALSRWYPAMDRHLLVSVTEMNSVADIDRLVELLASVPA